MAFSRAERNGVVYTKLNTRHNDSVVLYDHDGPCHEVIQTLIMEEGNPPMAIIAPLQYRESVAAIMKGETKTKKTRPGEVCTMTMMDHFMG